MRTSMIVHKNRCNDAGNNTQYIGSVLTQFNLQVGGIIRSNFQELILGGGFDSNDTAFLEINMYSPKQFASMILLIEKMKKVPWILHFFPRKKKRYLESIEALLQIIYSKDFKVPEMEVNLKHKALTK